MHGLGEGGHAQNVIKYICAWFALVAGRWGSAGASYLGGKQDARRGEKLTTSPARDQADPTSPSAFIGGFVVGLTSVGSGSLMVVLLLLLYPRLSTSELVGPTSSRRSRSSGRPRRRALLFGDFQLG